MRCVIARVAVLPALIACLTILELELKTSPCLMLTFARDFNTENQRYRSKTGLVLG
jgi:hypothetical protein